MLIDFERVPAGFVHQACISGVLTQVENVTKLH